MRGRQPGILLILLATALAASGLAGCAHNRPAPDLSWSAADMATLTRFSVQGKVGFRHGETGGSAALTWQQDGDRYRMMAHGPLGQGATRISGDSALIRIEDKQGAHESDDPEALLAEAIGWPVSINSLAFWVRGLPAPGSEAAIENDPAGRPLKIRQQNWEIRLDRYRPDGSVASRRTLPHRIIAIGGDSRVTLLIERWNLGGQQKNP